jgi:hypothetical protein
MKLAMRTSFSMQSNLTLYPDCRRRYLDCAEGLFTGGNCSGLKICVANSTTYIDKLVGLVPETNLVRKPSLEQAVDGLTNRECNALAGGITDISPTNVLEFGYTGPYNTSSNILSDDPLALVTTSEDQRWSSFVFWVVSALFYAEENAITQSTASKMPIVNSFGPLYTRMFRDAIAATGNYKEIYARNAQSEIPRSGPNMLNKSPFGPQHYPLPGIFK